MNTQNLSTLQVFQSLTRNCKSHILQSCPKESIRFLIKCIVNLLKRNLQDIKMHHMVKFQDEIWLLLLKRLTWKQKKKRFVVRKRVATNSSHYTSHHYSFVLIWSSLFLSQLLCITRMSLRNLLQSRNFRSRKLNNLPRTKLILKERH